MTHGGLFTGNASVQLISWCIGLIYAIQQNNSVSHQVHESVLLFQSKCSVSNWIIPDRF